MAHLLNRKSSTNKINSNNNNDVKIKNSTSLLDQQQQQQQQQVKNRLNNDKNNINNRQSPNHKRTTFPQYLDNNNDVLIVDPNTFSNLEKDENNCDSKSKSKNLDDDFDDNEEFSFSTYDYYYLKKKTPNIINANANNRNNNESLSKPFQTENANLTLEELELSQNSNRHRLFSSFHNKNNSKESYNTIKLKIMPNNENCHLPNQENKHEIKPKKYPDEEQNEADAKSSNNLNNNNTNNNFDEDYRDKVEDDEYEDEEGERPKVLFPGYVPVVFKYLDQSTRPRLWCLKMITSPWFERISMFIIIVNCITLGMYQPCNDNPCTSTRCNILSYLDHVIYVFFAVEMMIKICAMGFYGKNTYMAETWNRLDFFIVIAGTIEYAIVTENLSLSAIRTVRVLRPLRAINRVPSMRILVMLLLDTLPMLGNVLLLCFFVFFIFGILGVQLWKGVLRNRCYFDYNQTQMGHLLDESFQSTYYKPDFADSFICTADSGSGMSKCSDIPAYINSSRVCNGTIELLLLNKNQHISSLMSPVSSVISSSASQFNSSYKYFTTTTSTTTTHNIIDNNCINWNSYYSKCRPSDKNPFKGAISFDNIGYAWVAIFQIISLESWVTIMYYIQDAHSFWDWIYFFFLIVIGSFFMINLCLVVIATQFSETKKRETERMIAERRRFSRSSSTVLSDSANGGDPGSCWHELLKFTSHIIRKSHRRLTKKYNQFKENRRRKKMNQKTGLNINEDDENGHLKSKCCCLCSKNKNTNEISHHLHDSTQLKKITTQIKINVQNNKQFYYLYKPNQNESELIDEEEGPTQNKIKQDSSQEKLIFVEECILCKKFLDSNSNLLIKINKPLHNDQAENGNLLLSNNNNNEVLTHQDGHSHNHSNRHHSSTVISNSTNRESKLFKKNVNACSNCWCCFCCCLPNCLRSNIKESPFCALLDGLQERLKKFVDGRLFQRAILFAILINTLSMGVEHHLQPAFLTLMVEYSNMLFTLIFLIEMILKILAYGVLGYIENLYNMFDGIIVGISVYEIIKHLSQTAMIQNSMSDGSMPVEQVIVVEASGVSVLRTFRLLRILKLVRFMPALRRQLIVMLKTIDNVATFFSLLILFIFIFSILGMNLFGCKFCIKLEDGSRFCERKNFDSLLWAIITVFQVLTQEDWNEVLYNGMEKTSSWAALYFIALMTFGNYVLFNLLVAILVEGFSTEDEPKKIEDRIRADAIHAIVNQDAHRKSTGHASNGFIHNNNGTNNSNTSRRNSSLLKKDRRFKSDQKEKLPSAGSTLSTSTIINIPRPSFHTEKSSELEQVNEEEDVGRQQQISPPIIIHTCPTPAQTPPASLCSNRSTIKREPNTHQIMQHPRKLSRNSFFIPNKNYKILFNSNISDEKSENNEHDNNNENYDYYHLINNKISKKRKFSLDNRPSSKYGNSENKIKSNSLNRLMNRSATDVKKMFEEIQAKQLEFLEKRATSSNNSESTVTNAFEQSSFMPILLLPAILINDTNISSHSIAKINNDSSRRTSRSQQSNIDLNKTLKTSNTDQEYEKQNTKSLILPISAASISRLRSNSEKLTKSLHQSTRPSQLHLEAASTSLERNNQSKSTQTNLNNLNSPSTLVTPRLNKNKVNRNSIKSVRISPDSKEHHLKDTVTPTFTNKEEDYKSNISTSNKSSMASTKSIQQSVSKKSNNSSKKSSYSKKGHHKKQSSQGDDYLEEDDEEMIDFKCCVKMPKPTGCFREREEYALYVLSSENIIRKFCKYITNQKWFDYTILLFIALNCITLAMERPTIPQQSIERKILTYSNYLFTLIFAIEMILKVFASCLYIGENAYLKSGWNVMDGLLVIVSSIDVLVSLSAKESPKIFGILRVFRLLRTLRPLRVISRAPGLKLVVQTLLSSLRPIGNIVLICCTFFIIFGILGVQLFKGKLYRCVGDVQDVFTKDDCLKKSSNQWINSQYNFDSLGNALMALFVLASKDGWVQIMYTGIDAVGVDKQPIENYNEWMLIYFISFLLLVGFFVLNMFVGVVIENFHKCRAEQEREEKARRAAKRARKFEDRRRKMKQLPYYANYSQFRRVIHDICDSKYFDLVIAGVIGLNVVTMSLEFYMMPQYLDEILDVLNLVFTAIFLLEAIMRMFALGLLRYFKERWNQLDIIIVIMSIVGIFFDKLSSKSTIPINPTLIRVMRVLRIARVLKLLKMAKGIRSLLDTVIQALPQVGNLGLLFFLLFFIFAILGVELFGKLKCDSVRHVCDGLSKHAHFHNFGMAFLTLFRIATGDNWNGIMKDTLKDNVLCQETDEVLIYTGGGSYVDKLSTKQSNATNGNTSSMCLASMLAPIYFVIFVLMAQFVLVNVVVAVLMKHLDESNKMMADDAEMDEEIEKQLEAEARNNIDNENNLKINDEFEDETIKMLPKPSSLPPNFVFDFSPETSQVSRDEMEEEAFLTSKKVQHNINPEHSSFLTKKILSLNPSNTCNLNGEKLSTHSDILQDNQQQFFDLRQMRKKSLLGKVLLKRLNSIDDANSKNSSNLELDSDLDSVDKVNFGIIIKKNELKELKVNSKLNECNDTPRSDSINNESDNVSAIMKSRKEMHNNKCMNMSILKRTPYYEVDFLKATNSSPTAGGFSLNPTRSSASQKFKHHFSPQSSVRIRVIDETDTDN